MALAQTEEPEWPSLSTSQPAGFRTRHMPFMRETRRGCTSLIGIGRSSCRGTTTYLDDPKFLRTCSATVNNVRSDCCIKVYDQASAQTFTKKSRIPPMLCGEESAPCDRSWSAWSLNKSWIGWSQTESVAEVHATFASSCIENSGINSIALPDDAASNGASCNITQANAQKLLDTFCESNWCIMETATLPISSNIGSLKIMTLA